MYEYKCKIVRVIDGDTVQVEVDHGMQIKSIQNIRLLEVFAPELDEPGGKEMKALLEQWCEKHKDGVLILNTRKDSRSFNRYIGTIIDAPPPVGSRVQIRYSMNEDMRKAIFNFSAGNTKIT